MEAEKGLQTARVGLERRVGQIPRAIPPAQLRRQVKIASSLLTDKRLLSEENEDNTHRKKT